MIAKEIQAYAEKFTSAESEILRDPREKTFAERVANVLLAVRDGLIVVRKEKD